MAATEHTGDRAATSVRVAVTGSGSASVSTGVPVLDHLLAVLAEYASFDLSLEVAPGAPIAEIAAAGRALGEALSEPLRAADVRRHGSAVVPMDEALAHVALEASGRPLVVSNVDLSREHIAGVGADVVGRFLEELAEGAGLTVHVRLIHGNDAQHVLAAIFKALGVSLAQASRPRRRS